MLVIYKDYIEMHVQQNIKLSSISAVICVSLFDFFHAHSEQEL
jgi:hypothetical protein